MADDTDAELADALDTQRGDALLARLAAMDADRIERADPIYPTEDELTMAPADARALVARFRAIRDAHRGELAVDRMELPDDPGRVAAAIVVALQADTETLTGRARRSAQRAGAEDLVDLQSFRPSDEVARIDGRAGDDEREAATARLLTAKAGAITLIRDDPSVLGSINALRGVDLRIGGARPALDAVNRYRETQAFGFLAMFIGIPVVIVIVVAIVLILIVANA